MISEDNFSRPSPAEIYRESKSTARADILFNKSKRVARGIEERLGLSHNTIGIDLQVDHYLTEDAIRNAFGDEIPTIVTGEVDYFSFKQIISSDKPPDYQSEKFLRRNLGINGTREEMLEEYNLVKSLYPNTTFITADPNWYFDATSNLLHLQMAKIMNSISVGLFLGAGSSSIMGLLRGLKLPKITESNVEKKIQHSFDEDVSRRDLLKLSVSLAFTGAVLNRASAYTHLLEKDEEFLKFYEGVVYFRNLCMVQNFWNILSQVGVVGSEDLKILFFAGSGHSGCLNLLEKNEQFTAESLYKYAQLFIDKIYEWVHEMDDKQNQSLTDSPAELFANYVQLFTQPIEMGNYKSNTFADNSPPAPYTIFVRALVEKIDSFIADKSIFFEDVLVHMMRNLQILSKPLSTDPEYGHHLTEVLEPIEYSVLYVKPHFKNIIQSGTGKVYYSEVFNQEWSTSVGLADVSGRTYPIVLHGAEAKQFIKVSNRVMIGVEN